jgi:hypothetical protein
MKERDRQILKKLRELHEEACDIEKSDPNYKNNKRWIEISNIYKQSEKIINK